MSKDLNTPISEDSDIAADQEDNPELVDVTLLSSIVDKDLGELDGGESESMKCEHQVLISYLLIIRSLVKIIIVKC